MGYVRPLLIELLALAVLVATDATMTSAELGAGHPYQEVTDVSLSGPQVVVVRDLPQSAVVHDEERRGAIPRLTPDVGIRATSSSVPPAAETNVLDPAAQWVTQAMTPPAISTTFEGVDDNVNFAVTSESGNPPDPQVAVGPNHVVEFVNIVGRITDKGGAVVVPDFSLDSFFDIPPANFDFDPKIIYDALSGRFFASYVDIDLATGDGFLSLAISQTSDPTGVWNVYFVGPFVGATPDFPGIGVTNDKFTISYNLFSTGLGGFIGEQTLVFEKADVMAGVASPDVGFTGSEVNPNRFTVRPAQNLSPGNDQYLTTWDLSSFDQLTVIRITGTPNAGNVAEASATNLTTLFHDSPPPSVTAGVGDCIVSDTNLGSPPCIDSGIFRMLEAVWRDNSLWSSASAACFPAGDDAVRSCAHLVEVETVGAPSVVQDILFGAFGGYVSFPAIRTDSSGNLYVSFTHTDPSIFAEAMIAGRCADDPPNTMTGASVLRSGEIAHFSGRWGDYLGAAVDPSDPSSVWVVGEYAKDISAERWGTFIAKTSYSGLCADSDGDGVPDESDNCPAWPNPDQSLPQWSIPPDDPDCDGFSTADEGFIGTDPNLACGPDAWPPDHNSDGLISISDVLLMKASFGAKTPDDPIYDARRDLNPDGKISISDVLTMRDFFDQECT